MANRPQTDKEKMDKNLDEALSRCPNAPQRTWRNLIGDIVGKGEDRWRQIAFGQQAPSRQ